jgi:hypothetical protein
LKPCVTCGLERVSRRSKRERYPYNGLSRTSRNFGTSLCRARQVSVRHWGRCRVPKLSCSKTRVRARLPGDAAGRITYGSRANAVKGRVPA